MPDFLQNEAVGIYVSLAVALVVWIGIFTFLWRLDRQARELRQRLEQAPRAEQPAPRATMESRKGHPEAAVATNNE
jgi:CcmD family protein